MNEHFYTSKPVFHSFRNFPIFLIALLFSLPLYAAKSYQQEYPLYAPANIFVYSLSSTQNLINDLNQAFQETHQTKTSFFYAGSLERDSLAQSYFSWIQKNIHPQVNSLELRPRALNIQNKMRQDYQSYLLLLIPQGARIYALLFYGNHSYPLAVFHYPKKDSAKLAQNLINDFFNQKVQQTPTLEQYEISQNAPNSYYETENELLWYFGFGIGYSAANPLLTPRNWASHEAKYNEIEEFSYNNDTASAWNWISDQSPLWTIEGGLRYMDMLSLELQVRYTHHQAKIIENDSLYDQLDHWEFYRFEPALNAGIGKSFNYHNWNVFLLAQIGFLYSILMEDFSWKGELSDEANHRFHFESLYSGSQAAVSAEFLYHKTIGLRLVTGIAHRGLASASGTQDIEEPQKAGQTTLDYYSVVQILYYLD
jgi:hypothetical protein